MTAVLSPSFVSTEVLTVTPDIAVSWLEANKGNRSVRDHVVAQYEADMRAERWEFNGDPIRFSEDGRLLDGQHRLWAIVQSETAQRFLVIRGLPDEAQITMDQGAKRDPVDQLHLVGIEVTKGVAGAARKYIQWRSGRLFGDIRKDKVSTPEIVEWAQSHPAEMALLHTFGRYHNIPSPDSVTFAVALHCHLIDEIDAGRFFSSLATGASLATGSPALALLQRLRRDRDRDVSLQVRDLVGMFVVAWNAERDGRHLTKLQRPTGGWTVDTFPEPK